MIQVKFIDAAGTERVVQAENGESVMQCAINNLVDGIIGECGGGLSCATCHVYVDTAWIDKLDPCGIDEADMLEATSEATTECSRLACQVHCTPALDGLVIHLPKTQR